MKPSRWFFAAATILTLALIGCSAAASGGTSTWIDRPLDGDQFPLAPLTIQAHASAASGVSKFEFYINDVLTSSPGASGGRFAQTSFEWLPPAPGTYVVRARAIGGGGTGTEARSTILVGPAVTVIEPEPLPVEGITPPPVIVIEPEPLPVDGVTPPVVVIEPEPLPVEGITVVPEPAPSCPGVPIISSFVANPNTITAGGSSILTWGPITNADSALIDHGVGGPALSGGSFPVSPATTTTYVLSATGCGGTVVKSVSVTVRPACPGPPVIASFSANPSTITAGQSTTLSWGAVTNASSASIDPGVGGVGTPGSTNVSPGGTTTYTLTATGCGGTTRRQVRVTVNPASQPQPPAPKPIQPPPVEFVPVVPIIPKLPPADKTPPTISGVNVNPTSLQQASCGGGTATVTAQVNDAGGVSRVVVRLGGGGSGEVGMGGSGTYSARVGPFNSGPVTVQVVAWDKAGNSSSAGGPSIIIGCFR